MAVSPEFRTFVEEVFGVFGPVTIRSMFGGAGVYHQGIMFAIVADQALYLKVDDGNRADFEAAGMKPFTYEGKDKPVAMSYWEVPEALYEDGEAFAGWARKAFAAAVAAKAGDKPARRRRFRA